jgi:hypothetical protein
MKVFIFSYRQSIIHPFNLFSPTVLHSFTRKRLLKSNSIISFPIKYRVTR